MDNFDEIIDTETLRKDSENFVKALEVKKKLRETAGTMRTTAES